MVKKHSLKIRVSLKRSLGIGFTALLGTSPLGFSSGTYAMEKVPSTSFDLKVESENNNKSNLAKIVDFSPESPFCKFLESKGINVSKLSLENKREYLKRSVEATFESYCKKNQRWPKFLGKIEKNPTEILRNVVCDKVSFEVLDFIEKNYDEIKEKLPSDWIGLVKELYNLDEEQVAAIRECIDKEIISIVSVYGAKMDLGDLLGDRNMVFQYFMFCGSINGGSLSLDEAKSRMDNKEFFNSCIKRTLDNLSIIFTKEAVNVTKDRKEKGPLK